MEPDTRVTCSIVTYNNEKDIRHVLASLLQQVTASGIYVVDNASSDRTVEIVRQEFPQVNVIVLPSNKGFGAGHNAALAKVNSVFHIFVNPDIELCEGTIAELVSCMDAHPDIVCISPKVLNQDGSEQFLPKRYPTLRYMLIGHFENKFRKAAELRAEYTRKNEKFTSVTDIEFCSGCFMFARTEALKKAGGFDERYFMYMEDADLSRTLQRYGRTVFDPDACVIHRWKRESANNSHFSRLHMQSMLKYFQKWGFSF